jgi:hypothetical protein
MVATISPIDNIVIVVRSTRDVFFMGSIRVRNAARLCDQNRFGRCNDTVTRIAAAFAAVVIGAAAVLSGAQQQPSNTRAAWPCGGRLDPAYFQVAEGTGGHLLLLAPEEIGDSTPLLTAFTGHPQTIFRLAGSVTPGLHDFQIPIDPSVESVMFSVSVQCLEAAYVLQPSGALAGGNDVTDLSNFRAERMVIVRRPQPGVWTVRVAGRGVAGVAVQARSPVGIAQVGFAAAQSTRFTPLPTFGVENTLRMRISGRLEQLQGSLVSGVDLRLATLSISPVRPRRHLSVAFYAK